MKYDKPEKKRSAARGNYTFIPLSIISFIISVCFYCLKYQLLHSTLKEQQYNWLFPRVSVPVALLSTFLSRPCVSRHCIVLHVCVHASVTILLHGANGYFIKKSQKSKSKTREPEPSGAVIGLSRSIHSSFFTFLLFCFCLPLQRHLYTPTYLNM